MKYPFDSNAGIILVKTKVYGPAGDGIVNLALDTGATWTLVSWEIAVQLGYDPCFSPLKNPSNDWKWRRVLPKGKTEAFGDYGKMGFEPRRFVSHSASD